MTKNNYTNMRQKVQQVLEDEGLDTVEAAMYSDELVDNIILDQNTGKARDFFMKPKKPTESLFVRIFGTTGGQQ